MILNNLLPACLQQVFLLMGIAVHKWKGDGDAVQKNIGFAVGILYFFKYSDRKTFATRFVPLY